VYPHPGEAVYTTFVYFFADFLKFTAVCQQAVRLPVHCFIDFVEKKALIISRFAQQTSLVGERVLKSIACTPDTA
jgi:hypothetical protein